jgi:hypothetical protein
VNAMDGDSWRHIGRRGPLWLIGLSATMLVLLVGLVLGGASLGLLGPCGDSVSSRRKWGKAATGVCAALVVANVAAYCIVGMLTQAG